MSNCAGSSPARSSRDLLGGGVLRSCSKLDCGGAIVDGGGGGAR